MGSLMEKNRVVILSIAAALVSLAISYAGHVEYFKAFAVVFAVVGSMSTLLGSYSLPQKVRSAGLFCLSGIIMYLIACFLWK